MTNGNDGGLDRSALEAIRADFRGELIDGESPGYERARVVWNARIDRRPAVIARCDGGVVIDLSPMKGCGSIRCGGWCVPRPA